MKKIICLFLCYVFLHPHADAVVKYDEGAVYIKGVVLLQDRENPKEYYYLPQYPRLSRKDDGTLEFLCIKYVGEKADGNGGLFHALIEFSLPEEVLKIITKELQTITPGARIAGPVPMMQPKAGDGENIPPSFEIVSGILSNKDGKDAFTRSVVTSGYAPLTPGSKAAVAALLNQQGATLLWNSFTGPTSDVSVSVHGYYEAAVKGYNAIVTAEMSTIYTHFSAMTAVQSGYTKRQVRDVLDDLQQKGVLKVEVFDRSAGLGIKTSDMEAILNLVTNKLTEIMFDTKTGWAKTPERVDPSLGFDPRGRQEKTGASAVIDDVAQGIADVSGSLPILGWFSPKKKQNLNPEYVTDNQYVLKNVKDVRSNKFYLNLSKSTTIKVPIHTSGNLGGIYSTMGTDDRYFRIVNMNDPAFQRRGVTFQVDGEFTDAFDDIVNFVTVNFRKKYDSSQYDVTDQIMFNAGDLKTGKSFKEISYPRLGTGTSEWLNYEYQLVWSLKGRSKTIRYPAEANQWIKSSDPAVSLVLPFVKEYIELDADRILFRTDSVSSANVSFASTLGGDKKIVRNLIMRQGDQSSVMKTTVYHDPGSPVVYQAKWYSPVGEYKEPLNIISSNYLFIVPPPPSKMKPHH